jgi:hypothetical protein
MTIASPQRAADAALSLAARQGPSEAERQASAWTPDGLKRALAAFQKLGFLEIPDALPRPAAEGLAAAYRERYATTEPALAASSLRVGDRRYQVTVDLTPPFDDPLVYANPFALPVIDGVLGGQAVLVGAGAVSALPGAADQHVHRDYPELFVEAAMSHMLPRFAAMMVVPLVDLDPATVGTTGVWPGSHRENPQSVPARQTYETALLPAPRLGSVYLMDYRLLHGGTANRSDRERPILYFLGIGRISRVGGDRTH